MDLVNNIVNDLQVLKTIWFSKISGDSHKERLENFYGPQADAYDHFRAKFLHGRRGMIKACAAKINNLGERPGLVWVDLGGGTGENVDMMAEYVDLSKFEKIYVVDLCGPLCEVSKKKAQTRGWKNVEVVEADVCEFEPESKRATLVTFSYSLSMIPPFMAAVDKALSYLDQAVGILGVADFYTSMKYDSLDRQHGYLTRWFWRAIFDMDNIELGPERRLYLDHTLERVYEENKSGGIPYVPFLKVPYFIWLGRVRHLGAANGI
ncbi:hypothetical protein MPTK1_8g09310 [Marchantia polymorpha subsp. ruderalis]|uniref:Methyltransferase domain-containing protein n=1 Tax=Marchantia polymorpha TaxID=3197 RepID=A0A2R6W2E2_MARPO|nr:hypothetical protein MARPO_0176s0014 [Marchantia polymorpha]BBN19278.1 hypothetical protein Mp_8g09310 [Marchantia polymorpha subsp. ruderalis]|eukprot:PTQ28030.1 hypothetical protein MARPO_0176s0014 [Marchantia polymorpha]